NQRVVGGYNATENQFPYQVSLRYNGNHNCGGSIIGDKWVLTAGHCVSGYNKQYLKVVAGSLYLSTGGTQYNVANIIVHPNWNPSTIKNDLAIIEIDGEFGCTDSVRSIPLKSHYIEEKDCVASGWGRLYAGGPIPNQLQYINLRTLLNTECQQRWGSIPVGDCEICTLTVAGEGVCNGDSGSPLVINGKQIGIVSWGNACANGIPDVYTRISCYINWILDIITE
ncbi:hypothetical protein Trydic_g15638, partial [Trypoxylus dichotomus]